MERRAKQAAIQEQLFLDTLLEQVRSVPAQTYRYSNLYTHIKT